MASSYQPFTRAYALSRGGGNGKASGTDRLDQRVGFAALLACCCENRVTAVVVENASRFTRGLIV